MLIKILKLLYMSRTPGIGNSRLIWNVDLSRSHSVTGSQFCKSAHNHCLSSDEDITGNLSSSNSTDECVGVKRRSGHIGKVFITAANMTLSTLDSELAGLTECI